MAESRPSAPAGFWLVMAAIFATNAVIAARNESNLMAFFALVAAIAALWTAWVALPSSPRSRP